MTPVSEYLNQVLTFVVNEYVWIDSVEYTYCVCMRVNIRKCIGTLHGNSVNDYLNFCYRISKDFDFVHKSSKFNVKNFSSAGNRTQHLPICTRTGYPLHFRVDVRIIFNSSFYIFCNRVRMYYVCTYSMYVFFTQSHNFCLKVQPLLRDTRLCATQHVIALKIFIATYKLPRLSIKIEFVY